MITSSPVLTIPTLADSFEADVLTIRPLSDVTFAFL